MNLPLISICVLNYNGKEFLQKIIPKLLVLNYPKTEIVVLDNGSQDGSVDFLSRYSAVKVLKENENLGYGAGKNRLVEEARGEYVLLLDNDILIEEKENVLLELLDYYKRIDNLSFLSFPLVDLGEEETTHYGLFYNSRKKPINIKELKSMDPFEVGGFIGGAVFFNREIFKELGGYDTKYPFNLDDYDLSARASIYGYKTYIYTKILGIHLGVNRRTDPKIWSWKNQYAFAGFGRVIIKNYKFKNVLIWLPLVFLLNFYKSFKKMIELKSTRCLTSYFLSKFIFLRDVSSTLRERRRVQSSRVVDKDYFLTIKNQGWERKSNLGLN